MITRKITGKRIGVIYKITNQVNGKCYIGQTIKRLAQRWSMHKSSNRRCPLTSSIKKHGYLNFKIEVLCWVLDPKDLDGLEIYYIQQNKSLYPNGYNLSNGGTIGNDRRGFPSWNKGLKASPETRAKLSAAHKGQKAWNKGLQDAYSKETREKMSLIKRGKRISPETEFKPGQTSVFKGKKHRPESLALISENGNRTPIICIETGVIYPSIIAASAALGVSKSYLRRKVISQKRIEKLNMTFRYA